MFSVRSSREALQICLSMKDWLQKLSQGLGVVGALAIAFPILFKIHEGETIFNPLSYFMWSSLSVLAAVVLYRAGEGGWQLLAAYWASDFSIASYAYFKARKLEFGWFEGFVIGLVAVCTIIWLRCETKRRYSGQTDYRASVIANATALMLAGVPQVWDAWKKPNEVSMFIAWSYIGISVASFFGESKFNGRLVPGVSIVYWIVIMIPVLYLRT